MPSKTNKVLTLRIPLKELYKMNPLTALAALEKIINEHGSSEILNERLSLVKEQHADTQSRLANALNDIRELKVLVSKLKSENDILKQNNKISNRKKEYSHKHGCIFFHEDPSNLYCPSCFFNDAKKIPTSRKNSKLRFCPVCKTDIPSG